MTENNAPELDPDGVDPDEADDTTPDDGGDDEDENPGFEDTAEQDDGS